jgi:hypothetical protein
MFPNGNHSGVNNVPYSPCVIYNNSLYYTPSAGSFSSTYQSRNYPGISSIANSSSVPKFLHLYASSSLFQSTNAVVPQASTLSSPICPGVFLNWKGLFYSTYPFSIHEIPPGGKNQLSYSLHTIGKDPLAIMIILDHCRGFANKNRGPCSSCESTYTLVEVVQDKADCAHG